MFVWRDSDFYGRFGSGNMPDFSEAVKEQLAKMWDEMPQGLMRDVSDTFISSKDILTLVLAIYSKQPIGSQISFWI